MQAPISRIQARRVATDRLVQIVSQLAQRAPNRLAEAVLYVAPGSRPSELQLRQIARTLGVRGVATVLGVPSRDILRAVGPELAAVGEVIEPNALFANGVEAYRHAFTPVRDMGCAACDGSMGGILDSIQDAIYGDQTAYDGSGPIKGDAPPPDKPTGSGWPGEVPFRPGNWVFTSNCVGARYTLAPGDTLSGLAELYLGDPSAYMDIWELQPFRYTKAFDPSMVTPERPAIKPGDELIMPQEACLKAKKYLEEQSKPIAPPTQGAPGTKAGAVDGLDPSAPTTKKKLVTAALIAGGVAVVAGGTYFVATR